jgi:hypothetical protein
MLVIWHSCYCGIGNVEHRVHSACTATHSPLYPYRFCSVKARLQITLPCFDCPGPKSVYQHRWCSPTCTDMHTMQQRLQQQPHCQRTQQHVRLKHARLCTRTPVAAADASSSSSSSSRLPGLDYTATSEPASPGFLSPELPAVQPWIRPQEQTFTPPSVRDSGTLRPSAEWYPAWMQYRRREDNYVFWQDKFTRCSLEIPGSCSRLSWQSAAAAAACCLSRATR